MIKLVEGATLVQKENSSGYSLILSDILIKNKDKYLVCVASVCGGRITQLGVEVATTEDELSSFVCSNCFGEKPLLILIEDDFMVKYKKRVLGFVELYSDEGDDMTFIVPDVSFTDKERDLFKEHYTLKNLNGEGSMLCYLGNNKEIATEFIDLDLLFKQREGYYNSLKNCEVSK